MKQEIIQGDCLDVMREMEDDSVDAIVTDPPYFRVKSDAWDRQWKDATLYLSWLSECADEWRRILKPNGSLYCFASPKMAARVEVMLSERFNVLNHIVWPKEDSSTRSDIYGIDRYRQFVQKSERVIFAEQYGDMYSDAAKALHKEVYAPLGRYIQTERERAGWTRSDLEVALGFVSRSDPTRGTALCYRWEEGSSLPTAETYERMREVLNKSGGDYLRREYEDLRREYEDLRREYEDLRRPFYASGITEDVWRFPVVGNYPGKHPCEKPVAMLEHIIRTSTREDATVLDCFAGSGSTGVAAVRLGRSFIGVERDPTYAAHAEKRIRAASEDLTLAFESAS